MPAWGENKLNLALNMPFSQQTFGIAGKAQVLLIALTMATFYLSVLGKLLQCDSESA